MQTLACRAPTVFIPSKPRWHAVKIFPPSRSQNRPLIQPGRRGLTPVFSLPYLPARLQPISSSLILTPRRPHSRQTCTWTLSTFIILYRGSIAARHLPAKPTEPPSDTSTRPSWHSALTCPAKTWQPSTYGGGFWGGGLRVQRCEPRWDLPDKNCTLVRGGEVSALIYPPVETCRFSPIHSSAVPLLWQPVCKYLLTLTRTKQCHWTSRWFSLHVSAERVSVLARCTRTCVFVCVCKVLREYT